MANENICNDNRSHRDGSPFSLCDDVLHAGTGIEENSSNNEPDNYKCNTASNNGSCLPKCHSNSGINSSKTGNVIWPTIFPPMLLRKKHITFPVLYMERQIGLTSRATMQRQCQLTRELINRLGVSDNLHGHRGCVNCIEFNDTGRLLVSGSDDCQILLWDVHRRKKLHTYATSHNGNIFTVKFLPWTGTGLLVSGAGDEKVEVRDVSTAQLLHTCTCHTNRVKRIATSPHLQHTFFSAAEDGTVLQYDLRAPHQCDKFPNNVVVNLNHYSPRMSSPRPPPYGVGYLSSVSSAEVKCVALSPRDPFKLAVGANDPYVRVYDRRMIRLGRDQGRSGVGGAATPEAGRRLDHLPLGCCQYFVPGHLPASYRDLQRKHRTLATTYLSYSADGRHLLANLGGENIYLYDTQGYLPPVRYTSPPLLEGVKASADVACGGQHSNGFTTNGYHKTASSCSADSTCSADPTYSVDPTCSATPTGSIPSPSSPLPPQAEALKKQANEFFTAEKWVSAVTLYSEALQLCPYSAVLCSNRAAALLHRGWEGDSYAALRDCFRALARDPHHAKAYHRLAKCLQLLGRYQEAKTCIEDFRRLNTELSKSFVCSKLYTEILNGMFQSSSSSSSGDGATAEGEAPCAASLLEEGWRAAASDYLGCFTGHCNTTTDIKEAVFLGEAGQFVAAGSDDGNLFIWETATANLVRVLPADKSIVNCVQCHPSAGLLATSGIEHSVKLWEPVRESEALEGADMEQTTASNQERMNADPLQMVLFMHMGDLEHAFSRGGAEGEAPPQHGGRRRYWMSSARRRRRADDADENSGNMDDEDEGAAPVSQHAIEFLRIPRPGDGDDDEDGGSGGGDGAGDVNMADMQCKTA